MRTLTLGPAGTYSHRAARSVSDDGVSGSVATGGSSDQRSDGDISFTESVHDIVDGVAGGRFDRGVVPIENSIEGSVTETLDALADTEIAVVREVVTPIKHALLARDDDVGVVASHPQALAQCRSFLDREYPDADRDAVASTAAGVERARSEQGVAAIAHPDNAGDDLRVLASDVQDKRSNATRFFVVAPPGDRSDAGGKSSLVVYPNANYPGLLLELLEPFADRDINLTRVESRPSGERLGDYVFHVDVDAGLYEDRTREAVAVVEDIADDGWVRRLGSYDVEHVV